MDERCEDIQDDLFGLYEKLKATTDAMSKQAAAVTRLTEQDKELEGSQETMAGNIEVLLATGGQADPLTPATSQGVAQHGHCDGNPLDTDDIGEQRGSAGKLMKGVAKSAAEESSGDESESESGSEDDKADVDHKGASVQSIRSIKPLPLSARQSGTMFPAPLPPNRLHRRPKPLRWAQLAVGTAVSGDTANRATARQSNGSSEASDRSDEASERSDDDLAGSEDEAPSK